MNSRNVSLIDEIRNNFECHWELNDPAHREKHFELVRTTATTINETLDLGYSPKLITFAAYFHDLFAWSRKNHHELSGSFIQNTDHPLISKYLNTLERKVVSIACTEHRASFKGNFSSEFAELINSADRELPELTTILHRSMDYYKHLNPDAKHSEVFEASVKHIKEKYSRDGYARYPDMYIKVFGDDLDRFHNDLDSIKNC